MRGAGKNGRKMASPLGDWGQMREKCFPLWGNDSKRMKNSFPMWGQDQKWL